MNPCVLYWNCNTRLLLPYVICTWHFAPPTRHSTARFAPYVSAFLFPFLLHHNISSSLELDFFTKLHLLLGLSYNVKTCAGCVLGCSRANNNNITDNISSTRMCSFLAIFHLYHLQCVHVHDVCFRLFFT